MRAIGRGRSNEYNRGLGRGYARGRAQLMKRGRDGATRGRGAESTRGRANMRARGRSRGRSNIRGRGLNRVGIENEGGEENKRNRAWPKKRMLVKKFTEFDDKMGWNDAQKVLMIEIVRLNEIRVELEVACFEKLVKQIEEGKKTKAVYINKATGKIEEMVVEKAVYTELDEIKLKKFRGELDDVEECTKKTLKELSVLCVEGINRARLLAESSEKMNYWTGAGIEMSKAIDKLNENVERNYQEELEKARAKLDYVNSWFVNLKMHATEKIETIKYLNAEKRKERLRKKETREAKKRIEEKHAENMRALKEMEDKKKEQSRVEVVDGNSDEGEGSIRNSAVVAHEEEYAKKMELLAQANAELNERLLKMEEMIKKLTEDK